MSTPQDHNPATQETNSPQGPDTAPIDDTTQVNDAQTHKTSEAPEANTLPEADAAPESENPMTSKRNIFKKLRSKKANTAENESTTHSESAPHDVDASHNHEVITAKMATKKLKEKTRPLDIVKVVAWCVIALALVKLAFFPGGLADDAQTPSADFTQSTVAAERGDITSSVTAEGTITQDSAGQLKAPLEGTVISIAVSEGQEVAAGTLIAQIQQSVQGEDSYSIDSEGNEIVTPGRTTYRSQWVTAPVAGTVHLSAVKNQSVNAGDSIGTVQPKTYTVVAQLTPDQMYRLTSAPEKARVSVKNGPQPFDCTGLKISTNAGSANEDGVTATNIEARCPIPTDIRVFPGQNATLTINAGEAKDVLVVPATAVEGRYQKGFVYLPDGTQKEVEIGLTDGNMVEIRGGLEEGEEILEYVPGGETAEMSCDPMTGEGC